MRERALTFGPANLVGILTQPDPRVAIPDAPATIVLNSGILHRPGASRINVQVARAFAEEGLSTLRFDFSGIGDSQVRRDSLPIGERFAQEAREAIDYLETAVGARRFLIGGLCSGADGAFWTALQDERVVGVWQIDAFCYKTPGYYIRRYGPRILDPRAWVNSVRVRIAKKAAHQKDEELFVKPEYRRVFPPKQVVEEGLGQLLDRGVSLYFLFTGGLEEYCYAGQHEQTFRRIGLGERARIRFIAECSHMVTGLEHQRTLLSDLRAWIQPFRDGARRASVA